MKLALVFASCLQCFDCDPSFGKDYPDSAASLDYLANLYRDQGKYAEAEPRNHKSIF
ncbi:MAG: tetratricopeptide repeat protein [Blastocatellia bacterium]|nr:tetratricopeptide repeat protein [Blastocatellia bacterium]